MRKRIVEFIERKGVALLAGLLLIDTFFLIVLIHVLEENHDVLGGVSFGILLICYLLVALISSISSSESVKVYYLLFGAVLLCFVGFQLHIAGTGPIFVFLMGMIVLNSLIQAITGPFRLKGNIFLQFLSFLASLVIAAGFAITLFKMQRWLGGDFMMTYASPLFVALTVVIVIGVQLTDFDKWLPDHRNFLIRNIMIPWSVVFVLGGSLLLFPDQFYKSIRGNRAAWDMVKYDLPVQEGPSEPELQ